MSETNAIVTSGVGKTPPAAGCPDAKREGSQTMDSSAAPLPGRRCPSCKGKGCWQVRGTIYPFLLLCPKCQGTGERSGPGNVPSVPPADEKTQPKESDV